MFRHLQLHCLALLIALAGFSPEIFGQHTSLHHSHGHHGNSGLGFGHVGASWSVHGRNWGAHWQSHYHHGFLHRPNWIGLPSYGHYRQCSPIVMTHWYPTPVYYAPIQPMFFSTQVFLPAGVAVRAVPQVARLNRAAVAPGPPQAVADAQGMVDFLRAHQAVELARNVDGHLEAEKNRPAESPVDMKLALANGDQAFTESDFAEAVREYQRAVELRPEQAVGWLRLGFGLIAIDQRAQALSAFKEAATKSRRLHTDDCNLSQLYRGQEQLKSDHLNRLAKHAIDQPDSSSHWLLVGVFLWFDGQQDRAESFLKQASSMAEADEPLRLVEALRAGPEN